MIDQEDSWLMMGEEKNSARAWWEKISYIVSRGAPRRELPPGFFAFTLVACLQLFRLNNCHVKDYVMPPVSLAALDGMGIFALWQEPFFVFCFGGLVASLAR